MKRLIALAIVAVALYAGDYTTGTSHRYVVGIVPATTAVAVSGTVYVSEIVIINDSSSAITITVKDRGSDCSGGCLLAPSSLSVAAKTLYIMTFKDQVAPSGVSWSSSDGTNVTGRIHYRTSVSTP